MKTTKAKKWNVKSIPDEDTTVMIDSASPLNLQQLINAAKKSKSSKKIISAHSSV